MKIRRKSASPILAAGLLVAALACGGVTPTPDATLEAQVTAAMATAETLTTLVAGISTPPPTLDQTPTPAPEYVEMAEEELAAEVDEAIVEAANVTEEAAAAAEEAAADGVVTQEEVDSVAVYVADAEEAIAYADELIYAYYALYGDLAEETIILLQAIEEDLDALATEATEIEATLQEIETALEQGLALAEETLAQLEQAAQAASAKAAEIRTQSQGWQQQLAAERADRIAAIQAILPNDVPANRQAAIRSAFAYVDAVREGLADGKITQAELADIAQLGANASAGLKAHGGPQMQQHADSIDAITQQLAGGQIPQARANLGNLESALGNRPSRP